MIRQVISASLLGAALVSAAPAFAQDVRTVKVSYADLNLTQNAGAAAFQRRVDHAIVTLCGEPTTGDLSDYAEVGRCRAEAHAGVKPQMAMAFARAADPTGSQAIVLASR